MAQKVQILLTDDISGEEADETVVFGLDGRDYEIDLTTENADKLRDLLTEFVEAGRKTGGRGRRAASTKAARVGSTEDTAKIRAWAKENGYDINERGRVPANIREAYDKAH